MRLHQTTLDHPLAVAAEVTRRHVDLQHQLSLPSLQGERVEIIGDAEQQIQARVTTLPTPTTLRAMSTNV